MAREHARVVVFDLGEVLASPGRLLADLAERAGLDEPTLATAYWAHRDAHDRGNDADTYWRAVLAAAGRADDPEDETVRRALAETDARVWSTIRPDARATLAALHDAGVRVAILSNAPHPMARASRAADWGRWVDDWFFSAELGLAKPDAAIYAAVTSALGVPGERVVFFDDRQVNVDAALRAGWDAYLWTSAAGVQETLHRLGLLPG
ncbi:putative hydrolase of the HAD superfamily [Microlunatus sagamiharensis]|uniref:Putative hydrolase of the HAD superfamily n=1 Tax=Microlunatus sagamiharensis TaxID=546874 RepID=A0A1H2LRU0_9ACTN|nr:HAD-IA family hydrolase [Microlunatus sagamiharensis]SDU83733.1 putative hydrolase of the HAD superfamily [Microlunatus sagamiharensis]